MSKRVMFVSSEEDLSVEIWRTDALGNEVYRARVPMEVRDHAIDRLIENPSLVSEVYCNPGDGYFYKIQRKSVNDINWERHKRTLKDRIRDVFLRIVDFPEPLYE